MKTTFLFLFAMACVSAPSIANAQFTINLNTESGMSQQSIDAFRAAADIWEAELTDNATVNLDVGFRDLGGGGTLAQAGSLRTPVPISTYLNALAADATSMADNLAIASYPTLDGNGAVQFRAQNGSSTIQLDNDGSANNRFLALNTANQKALGIFSGGPADPDASITFNSQFNWDFDQSDGVGAGLQDFVGVAVHEIGHALGFVSGVDSVDASIDSGQNLDNFAVHSGLDLFRYSAADGVLDWSAGTASYFSIDGGTTNLGLFSTGVRNGDGRQASHWKDNLGIGIMDPTANPAGQINLLTDDDRLAFDIMGWDLAVTAVPEPAASLVLAMFGLAGLRRRRAA